MDVFNPPTVLWEHASVVCTSQMVSSTRVDVTLTASGVVIQQKTFPTSSAAANYAIEQLNAYGVGRKNT
jgi:hypothetical protein